MMLRTLILVALGVVGVADAQPDLPLAWERFGDQPFDSHLPPSLAPDGHLWYGGTGEYPNRGVLRLLLPYDTTVSWEILVQDRAYWAYVVGPDTALTEDGEILRTTDEGETWTEVADQGRVTAILQVPPGLPHAGRIIASTGQRMASYSDDRGATWTYAPRGFDFSDPPTIADSAEALSLALVTTGPNAGRLVAAGLSGLTTSDDGGHTWHRTSEWAYFEMRAACVAALRGQAPGGGDRLVAVVNDARVPTDSVYVTVSDDGGETWRRTASLWYGAFPTCIEAVDLGAGRGAAVMMRGPVWGTDDGGETWGVWSEAPPGDPAAGPEARNDRASWAWVGPDGRLYVGVYRNGVDPAWDVRTTEPVASWAIAGKPTGPAPLPDRIDLSVYPNPTSIGTTVTLRLAVLERVRVVVLDVLGREVAVVYDGSAADGQRVAVETAGLAPGVYRVRATAVSGATATTALTVAR